MGMMTVEGGGQMLLPGGEEFAAPVALEALEGCVHQWAVFLAEAIGSPGQVARFTACMTAMLDHCAGVRIRHPTPIGGLSRRSEQLDAGRPGAGRGTRPQGRARVPRLVLQIVDMQLAQRIGQLHQAVGGRARGDQQV